MDKQESIFYSKNRDETQRLGENFAQNLVPGDVIYLYGDLGAGKTTFVKGVGAGLGIKTRIISPTFVIVREHKIKSRKIKELYHIDLYRLKDEKNLTGIDLHDLTQKKDAVICIEWPEAAETKFSYTWKVSFKYTDENTREIKILHI